MCVCNTYRLSPGICVYIEWHHKFWPWFSFSFANMTINHLSSIIKEGRPLFFFFLWIAFFFFFFFKLWVYLFIYLWLCWVFVSVRGPSPAATSGGHSSSRCAGLSSLRPLLLRSTGSRRAGSAIVAHGPSRSTACGTPPDQGPNPCPPHWQADSQPLRHEGNPGKTS